MPIAFNMIPLVNTTNCTLQLEDWTCGGEALPNGGAMVVDCTSVGVLDIDSGIVYTWVGQRTLNPPTVCAYSGCTPNVVTLTIWNTGAAAGKLAASEQIVAKASGKGAKPSAKPASKLAAAGKAAQKASAKRPKAKSS